MKTESKCSRIGLLSKLNSLIYDDKYLYSLCINDGISLYNVKLVRFGADDEAIIFKIFNSYNVEIGLFLLDDVKKIEYEYYTKKINDDAREVCGVKAIYNHNSKEFTIYEDND